MYCPPAFAEDRPDVMAALIRANPLGLLISVGPDGPTANAVPFDLGADGRLRAHLARANPQLAEIAANGAVLVVFQGEHSYISPSLYATKQQTGKVVPTWNYLMVQARGHARLMPDAEWLRDQVGALSTQMEQDRADPWAVSDAPESYISSQLRGIVGLEIELTTMQGKWKASQNRVEADRTGVASALSGTHPALSAAALRNT